MRERALTSYPGLPAVIFDMDGLLLDTERVCLDCFVDTRRLFGLSDSPEVFLRCVGLRGKEAGTIIIESLGDSVDYEDFNSQWDRKIDARLHGEIPRKPGAETLIQILAAKGISMGVATSTQTDRAQDQLGRCNLLRHFECVIGGDQVKKHKPDPEIYLKVAHYLRRDISECFAFEDSDAGTRAAIASGAKTVQIPDLTTPSAMVRGLGHLVAPNILDGAIGIGLISSSDRQKTL